MGIWVCTAGLLRLDMGAAGLLMAALLFLVMPRCSREEAQGVLAYFRGFLCGLALPGIPRMRGHSPENPPGPIGLRACKALMPTWLR